MEYSSPLAGDQERQRKNLYDCSLSLFPIQMHPNSPADEWCDPLSELVFSLLLEIPPHIYPRSALLTFEFYSNPSRLESKYNHQRPTHC